MAGKSSPASTAMIEMTTSNSTSVNPCRLENLTALFCRYFSSFEFGLFVIVPCGLPKNSLPSDNLQIFCRAVKSGMSDSVRPAGFFLEICRLLECRRLHDTPGQENAPLTIQKIPTPSAGKKERASAITLLIPGT